MTVVALPKGRLLSYTHEMLRHLGIDGVEERRYRYWVDDPPMDIRTVKLRDTARLVGEGVVSLGIAADEWIAESDAQVTRIASLGWYRARLCVVGPVGQDSWDVLHRKSGCLRVATEYPNVTHRYFDRLGVAAKVIAVSGSAEALVPGVADVAVDCVESGRTLKANGLSIIESIMDCDVHLVANAHSFDSGSVDDAITRLLDSTSALLSFNGALVGSDARRV